jgi:UDPglucose 6-dehydrogenase
MKPDRILIGSARTLSGLRAAAALADVYAAWVPRSRIVTVNTFSSELAKLVANAMLAQRISSINAVSALCDALGEGGHHTNGLGTADVEEVSLAIGRDARLGPRFLQAGVGFGGSCFEKDIRNLAFLARELHLDEVADYWLGVLRINEDQRRRFARGVVRALNGSLRGKKVAVLGFAFKDGTNDTRNSIAVHVISDLLGERPKEIAVFDPGCAPEDIREEIQQGCESGGDLDKVLRVCSGWRECVQDASAVCILTPWKQFRGRQLASGVGSTRSSMGNEVRLGENKAKDGLHGVSLAEQEGMVMQQFKRLAEDETAELSDDSVDQLKPLPPCPPECTQCGHGVQSEDGKRRFHDEMVDWAEVARLMKEPRWVFDGRNIVDHAELQGMGFRVRGIGKAVYGV